MSARVAAAAALVATALAGSARPARADELELRPAVDLPLVFGGAAFFLASEIIFKDAFSPDSCRWCARNGLDCAVRDGLRWDSPARAARISDWTGFVAAPIVTIGGIGAVALFDGTGDQWITDGVIVLESAIVAGGVTNLVKGVAGRQRPFLSDLVPSDWARTSSPQENNLSFFSGHSSFSMSLAVSAGTVASLRNYRLAPAVWATGVGVSLTTGYLRIAADRHWATDVVTGWVVGAAVGFAVPYFLHRRSTSGQAEASVGGPRVVSLGFAW